MKKATLAMVVLSLAGCAGSSSRHGTYDQINEEMDKAVATKPQPAQPDAVSASLLPPLNIEMPKSGKPLEQRFDLVFSNAPAAQVFMGIVSGTRYSVLLHPDVAGSISANLKDVTVFDALDAIRELYGYDYKVDGTRIFIQPLTMQTRMYQVNYLTGSRKGTSDIRVTSGSVSDSPGSGATPGAAASTTITPGGTSRTLSSSKISTTSDSDFWNELKTSLEAIVGNKEGRSVVISPQSGVLVIRAMPEELKNVTAYLKATQLSVDRQVILEAKILEVQLNDSYQAGINWAGFGNGPNSGLSVGNLAQGTVLQTSGPLATGATAIDSAGRTFTSPRLQSNPGIDMVTNPTLLGAGLFGLAFQTSNFAALINFLETQGNVHVLSSPRIATLNNQKAVLKVGTDEFFVTNVTTTSTSGTGGTTTSPSVTLQPFFSGIALDVTPQIDENGNIILHIHPSVSQVTTVDKSVNLGTAGSLILPLASSTISETDSVVRGQDGHIVAIGGLMRQSSTSDRSQVPGVGDVPVVGNLFRNTAQATQKRELVILLKPTVIQGESTWAEDMLQSQQRIRKLDPRTAEHR